MLDVILVSNFSMKDELGEILKRNGHAFYDLLIQDIQHIERYPVDDEYKPSLYKVLVPLKKLIQAITIYIARSVFMVLGPNCKMWAEKKFGIKCLIPDKEYSSVGLIDKIENDNQDLGKTLLLKGIGGKETIKDYLLIRI
jgi:hypothetical protein